MSIDLTRDLPRFQVTAKLWQQMIAAGVLGEDDKVELIEGVMVPMSPQGLPHTRVLVRLSEALRELPDALVLVTHSTLPLGPDSQPEPDLAVVPRRELFDGDAEVLHPTLCIEVANTSLAVDRQKIRMYARYNVAEAWIADVNARTIEIYTDPDPASARYRTLRTVAEGTVSPGSLPGIQIDVARLFTV